jgi:DNA primase
MAHSDRSSEAAAIWDASAPAARTLAERYLRGRGIRGTIPASIRFASLSLGQRGLVPALVASVSTLTGKVLGIQRTFLTPDGSAKATLPGGKSKLSLGRVKGGAIRLGAAGPELIVTEGLEDGLSLQQELGLAVWVAGGASMLPAMQLPALVRTVTIGADNDAAGGEAARLAAAAFRKSGKQVRIMRPSPPHKDFNAQLMATWNGG